MTDILTQFRERKAAENGDVLSRVRVERGLPPVVPKYQPLAPGITGMRPRFIEDVQKSFVRDAILGVAEGIARGPAAVAEGLGTGKRLGRGPALGSTATTHEKLADSLGRTIGSGLYGVSQASNWLANQIKKAKDVDALAADPASATTGTDVAAVKNALSNPAWWTNQFPGLAGNAVALLVPGIAASKLSVLAGASKAQAAKTGMAVSSALITAAEAGSSYEELYQDLRQKKVSDADARLIAGRGATAYGIVSGLVERGILPMQAVPGMSSGKWTFLRRILAGGTGEMSEEQAQNLIQGVMRINAGEAAGVDLDSGINAMSITTSGIAGFGGGAALNIPGAISDVQAKEPTDASQVRPMRQEGEGEVQGQGEPVRGVQRQPEQEAKAGAAEEVGELSGVPFIAIRLKDGSILSDPSVNSHAELVEVHGIELSDIRSSGFDTDGEYSSAQEPTDATSRKQEVLVQPEGQEGSKEGEARQEDAQQREEREIARLEAYLSKSFAETHVLADDVREIATKVVRGDNIDEAVKAFVVRIVETSRTSGLGLPEGSAERLAIEVRETIAIVQNDKKAAKKYAKKVKGKKK